MEAYLGAKEIQAEMNLGSVNRASYRMPPLLEGPSVILFDEAATDSTRELATLLARDDDGVTRVQCDFCPPSPANSVYLSANPYIEENGIACQFSGLGTSRMTVTVTGKNIPAGLYTCKVTDAAGQVSLVPIRAAAPQPPLTLPQP